MVKTKADAVKAKEVQAQARSAADGVYTGEHEQGTVEGKEASGIHRGYRGRNSDGRTRHQI